MSYRNSEEAINYALDLFKRGELPQDISNTLLIAETFDQPLEGDEIGFEREAEVLSRVEAFRSGLSGAIESPSIKIPELSPQ